MPSKALTEEAVNSSHVAAQGAEASVSRREQARRSRLRILRAAREAFAARGYHGATMAEIASGAGVAVQTVSYFFRTKPGLLSDLIGAAVVGELDDHSAGGAPGAATWFREAVENPDGRAALRAFAGGAVDVLARAATTHDAARVAALTDPDVASVYRQAEDRRLADYGVVAQSLADHGVLRSDIGVQRATDVLAALVSPQLHLTFAALGWTEAEQAEWLADALVRVLLAPA